MNHMAFMRIANSASHENVILMYKGPLIFIRIARIGTLYIDSYPEFEGSLKCLVYRASLPIHNVLNGSLRGPRDAAPLSRGSQFFKFHAVFWEKIDQVIALHIHL